MVETRRPRLIDVWTVELAKIGCGGSEDLSDYERARAERLRFADDRAQYLAARWALRIILSWYSGVAPAAIRYALSTYGKPRLVNGCDSLHFSYSLTRGVALVAVTAIGELGIDVEGIDGDRDMGAVMQFACSEREFDVLQRWPDGDPLFWMVWTRKEAVLKAAGYGFYREPRTIEVVPPAHFGAHEVDYSGQRWTVRDLRIGGNYAACLAYAAAGAQVRMAQFP